MTAFTKSLSAAPALGLLIAATLAFFG